MSRTYTCDCGCVFPYELGPLGCPSCAGDTKPAILGIAGQLRSIDWTADDLIRATGRDRRTVWRWLTGRTEVPVYVRTILQQQRIIAELQIELNR